jgi:hypothetical protein
MSTESPGVSNIEEEDIPSLLSMAQVQTWVKPLVLTGSADSQWRVPLMVALALALGAALQSIPIFTFQSNNISILIHFPKLWSLLDSIDILWEATVYLCN